MFSNLSMTLLCALEAVLTVVLALLFFSKGLHRRYPAMARYLMLRAVGMPVLEVLLWATQYSHQYIWYVAYFWVYWAVYLASSVLLYFVCLEIFRSALSPFPGLVRLGLVAFRWVALVSMIVSFASFPWSQILAPNLPLLAEMLMRSVSLLELSLLAFLCLCMNTLKLSARDMAFGISFGLGLLAASDFTSTVMIYRHTSLVASWQFVCEGIVLAVWGLWIAYAAAPQLERKPVMVAANSPIYRWNEIATALGHTGTRVAVQQPASSFFLTDVERVVERVLARNLKEGEEKL